MKKQILRLMIAVLTVISAAGFAMGYGDYGKKMEHGKSAMDHGGKAMDHGKKTMDDPASAMDHGQKAMDHGGKAMDHGKMMMDGDMIMLQEEEVDGVKGSAHLMDVKEKMAEHGMKQTHHMMIGFTDSAGKALTEGKVAVKVESPDEKVSEPIMMMGMDGQFGADITLDQKGMYHFKIGTKLADGQKRTFHMHYMNE